MICLGALLYFGWTLPGPSYNLLNAASTLVSAGLLLGAVGTDDAGSRHGWGWRWAVFGSGAALGVSLFSRFPSAIGLFGLTLVVAYAWVPPGRRWRFLLWLALGIAAWSAVHFVLFQGLDAWYRQGAAGARFVQSLQAGYGAPLLQKYLQDLDQYRRLAWRGYRFLFLFLLILGVAVWWIRRHRRTEIGRRFLTAALLVLLLVFAARSVHLGYQYGGDEYYRRLITFYLSFGALLGGILLVARLTWLRQGSRDAQTMPGRRILGLIALLSALPLLGAIGTGNPISLAVMLNLAPWFALLVLMLETLGRWSQSRLLPAVGTLVLVIFACSQIMTAGEVSPYRLNTALSSQVVPTELGIPPSTVRLDRDTSAFFESLRQAAHVCGLVAGDDILGFFNMPGVVFALGGRSPGGPWYNGGYPGDRESNAFLLQLAGGTRVRTAYLLQNTTDAKVAELLAPFGAVFPDDYRLCGSARWPQTGATVRLWKPSTMPQAARAGHASPGALVMDRDNMAASDLTGAR